jgi:hypothetical protein
MKTSCILPSNRSQNGTYREPSNRAALQNLKVVREKVEEWMEQGAALLLAESAWCTNPLSVAMKLDTAPGKENKRVVLDLSRHMEIFSVKIDYLGGTEGLKKRGDHMIAFDLETQFFHVKLAPVLSWFTDLLRRWRWSPE